MLRYVGKRVMEMIPTTVGVLLLTFALFYIVGGSPAQVILGKNATAEKLADFDAKFGYDKPLFCGNWAQTRALPDAQKISTNNGWHVSLAYALPAGVYRLKIADGASRQAKMILRNVDDGMARTHEIAGVAHGGAWQAEFVVADGWRAAAVEITGNAPKNVQLRRRTNGFFDSQFVHFVGGLMRGDFGKSAEYDQPVWQILKRGVGPSLALTIPILVGGTIVALVFGLWCAMWRGGFLDRMTLLVSTLLMSVNYVLWVLAGQYFLAFKLRMFPIWGFEDWTYILLPALIGIVGGLGRDIRFFRAVILDEIYKPYVRTAWAKGLSGRQVMVRHVLRNALIPVVTYVSLSIPFLFTGSLLLESFYGIPGLGCVSLNAIHSSDMAVVRAVVIIGALLYQVVNLVTDLCYAWLDPRVRLT
jgi:peptide/nickel transport system permease protein